MQEQINRHIAKDNCVKNSESKPIKTPIVKKIFTVVAIILGSLLLTFGGGILIIHHHKVQTYIIGVLANHLSESLSADVQIRHFHYHPLNHLSIDSLYISDQQRDTLAFIEQANISINLLQLRKNHLDLTSVELQRPYVNLQSLNDSSLNCQFLLDIFQSPKKKAFPLRVNVDYLQFSDLRFRYNDLLISQLNLSLSLPILSSDSMDIQIHNLNLRAQLDQLDAEFNATLHGNLDSIFADKMLLVYRDKCIFDGDVAIYHPTKLDSLSIQANCNDLYTTYSLLQDALSQLQIKSITIPKNISKLGHIRYRGSIDGRLEHLNLHGNFTTSLGALNVKGYVEADTTLQHFKIFGDVSTNRFKLGNIFDNNDLGNIAFRAHVNGVLDSTQLTQCTAEANIQHIEYRGYTYQDIHFNGIMGMQEISGQLHIDDENIALQINGLADWSEEDTRLDISAHVSNLCPNALHLTNQYPDLAINAKTNISLFTSGKNSQMLDNLVGYLIIDTLSIQNGDKQATMKELKLNIDSEWKDGKPTHQMLVQSDYMTASISGDFQYTTISNTFQQVLSKYFPSIIQSPKKKNRQQNNLDFYAYFRNLQEISDVFDLKISIPSYPIVKGFMYEASQQINLQAHIPLLQTSNTQIENITFALNNTSENLNASLYMYNRLPKDNPTAAKIGDVKAYIQLDAHQDNVDMTIRLDNSDSVRNEGSIRISSHIKQYANQPFLDMHIHPSNIILNDSAWTINEADITYTIAEEKIDIQNFALSTDYQLIAANGTASPQAEDSITIELRNIDVQYLLSYTAAGESISVQGPLTGWATMYGLFTQPMVEAEVSIANAGLNNTYLGNLTARAHLDHNEKMMIIEGVAIDSTQHAVAKVNGKVIPANKWWGLDVHCDSVDIHLIDFWTSTFFSNPKGRAYGDVQIFGQNRDTWVTAKIYGKDIQLTLPQLGSTLYFSDSIFMDSTAIHIPDITVYDTEGHKGTFNGLITHTNFKNFQYNLNAQVNNMLAMNLPYDSQSLFYGKVYGTGNVNIKGDDYECRINVNARTEANSKFYLSVNTASMASNTSFIHFTQPDTTKTTLLQLLTIPNEKNSNTIIPKRSKLLLSLQLEVTPTADINIRLGGDDGIRGRGEGNIKITYDDLTEDVQMLGTYTLQSGVFSYSIGNIVRRNFDIADGSRVIWSGDPLSPTVDITGRYHTTASLRDLFGSEFSQAATNRSSVPVNCRLYMSDQLFNPTLKFAIELPQSDESVQSQINSIINTEEMLMRQVLYLLVFNRFYTADYLQNAQSVGLNETYSLLSSTITGQINSWLSKLTDVFTMGFNFRTDGEGETASQEYEANFQIQPIRQLVINGNFGYRYNDLSNRPFFGDLDIEYLLTPNGKLRAKAYTHTVDKYSLRQANTVQGLGLVFKHDFNWQKKKPNGQAKEKKSKKEKRK